MRIKFSILLCFITIAAFAQKKQIIFPPPVLGMDMPDFMDFCQVPNHKNERVYTRFIYRGTKEYWSLYAPDNKCSAIKAELDIPDSVEMQPEFRKMFKAVHKKYWSTYLIIDAVGFYDDKQNGYGHLGNNKSNFRVLWLIDVQKIAQMFKSSSR